MFIIRDGKVEFSGNKKEVINYIKQCYADEYWIIEHGNKFEKDWQLFKDCLFNMNLYVSNSKPKRK